MNWDILAMSLKTSARESEEQSIRGSRHPHVLKITRKAFGIGRKMLIVNIYNG